MRRRSAPFVVAGLVVAAALAFFVSPHASSAPDGLDKVAIDQGFDRAEQPHALADVPTAGYDVTGVRDERISTGLAGLIGVGVTFAVSVSLVAVLRRARRGTDGDRGDAHRPGAHPVAPVRT